MFFHTLIKQKVKNMKHYILTRFALSGKKVKSRKWINQRLHILKNLTHPSIMNQTNKNFEWIIFSNEKYLNKKQKKELEKLNNEYCINIFKEDISRNWANYSLDYINNQNIKKNEIIITTRLDSDDLLSNTFVESIQNYFNSSETKIPYVLNFTCGYVFNYKNKNFKVRKQTKPNMFSTVISKKNDNLINKENIVLGCKHNSLRYHYKVIQLKGKNWLQLIHGNNICTTNLFSSSKNKKKY
jgi:hypothetical protein